MPKFKKTQKQVSPNSSSLSLRAEGQQQDFAPDTLLSTEKIIELAKEAGVDFAPGDAAERIRYFIKLGILPHAVRKTPDPTIRSSHYPLPTTPVGHLPAWTIKRLIQADKVYKKGASYPAIAQKIKKIEARENRKFESPEISEEMPAQTAAPDSQPIVTGRPAINLFPRVGLSEKEIERRFKEHEVKVRNIVEEELRLAVKKPPPPLPPNRFLQTARIFLLLAIVTGLSTAVFYAGSKFYKDQQSAQETAKKTAKSTGTLGQVLAASSERHRLFIDADTQVSDLTTFDENITAPNIIYSVSGGTGITVAGGQRPTISLDETEIVTSVNDLTGDLDVKGSGGTTISTSGSTITISSTAGLTAEADTLSTVTGRGATTSTLVNLDGGIAVDTSNFTVSGTTGDVVTAGDLAINGDDLTSDSNLSIKATGYVRIGDTTQTPDIATGDDDLYIEGDLEFNGALIIGTNGSASVGVSGQCLLSTGGGAPGWGNCASGASSPFQSISGVIDKFVTGDRLRLQYGDAGDVQLEIENTTNSTVPTADTIQLNLSGGSGITTDGVSGIYVNIEGGDGTNNTVSGINVDFDPVSGSSGDSFIGIDIDGVSGTSAVESALRIGSGWDRDISFADSTVALVMTASDGQLDVTDGTNTLFTIDDVGTSADVTVSGDLVILGGNINPSAALTIGDNGDTLTLDSSDWDINAAGDMTGIGAITADGAISFDPATTGDISFTVTSGDGSYFNILGLASGSGSALCIDGSNNVITCTTGAGGISGTGTAGQIAFFDTATSITSEASGFGWDATC